jgi:hypothetical protein
MNASPIMPAPRMELAILAIELANPPPAVRLAAMSSKFSAPSIVVAWPFNDDDERGIEESRLRRAVAESRRPTRRGTDWPPSCLPSLSSSMSSESSSYSAAREYQKWKLFIIEVVLTCFTAGLGGPESRSDDLDRVLEADSVPSQT